MSCVAEVKIDFSASKSFADEGGSNDSRCPSMRMNLVKPFTELVANARKLPMTHRALSTVFILRLIPFASAKAAGSEQAATMRMSSSRTFSR
jgi:hypothetical protein